MFLIFFPVDSAPNRIIICEDRECCAPFNIYVYVCEFTRNSEIFTIFIDDGISFDLYFSRTKTIVD